MEPRPIYEELLKHIENLEKIIKVNENNYIKVYDTKLSILETKYNFLAENSSSALLT